MPLLYRPASTQTAKSLTNDVQKDEQGKPVLSKAYDEFVDPIDKKNNGFDFHSESCGHYGWDKQH